MHAITECLYKLVFIQSDTGTSQEREMAAVIYEMIKANPYFTEHPEYYGTYMKNDLLDRPVVWALRRGTTKKTIILMGHYDAVDIEPYGIYKEYALDPLNLKVKFSEGKMGNDEFKDHLNDDNWAFGRGVGDMKAGIAINMNTLFTNSIEEVNILFVAVPDEENMSSGAIMSIPLYLELQERFNLDYKLCIVAEPEEHGINENIDFIGGSMGKFMPIIMAKGILTHAAYLMKGLNSGFIISEIIRNVELSISMIAFKNGIYSQPPTVQLFRDLKANYDVSVPEYSVALFNFMFLKTKSPTDYIQSIRDISEKALDYTISKYNETFDYLLGQNLINEEARLIFKPSVMSLSELEQHIIQRKLEYKVFKDALDKNITEKVQSKAMTLQTASIHMIKSLLEYSEITEPTVIIGISPPYYPAVANDTIPDKNADIFFQGVSEKLQKRYGFGCKHVYSNLGMTDISYFSCTDPIGEREFLNNMTVPPAIYNVPVEKIAKLNIPTFKVGPNSRDIHKIGERVYLPDVEERIPYIFQLIIENLAKENTNANK